jgi:hypothetical protein
LGDVGNGYHHLAIARAVGTERSSPSIKEYTMSNIDGPQNIRNETYADPPVVVVNEPAVVAQPAVMRPVVQQPVVQQPVVAPVAAVQSARVRRFAPDAVIAAVVGLVLLVVGLLAMVRGGFDGSMEDPVVEVLGFTHTTTLGIVEAVLGAFLLISGASAWRSGAIFFGSILAIGGFIGAVQTESFATSLALESSHAWIACIAGVVVVAAALLLPRYLTRTTVNQSAGVVTY